MNDTEAEPQTPSSTPDHPVTDRISSIVVAVFLASAAISTAALLFLASREILPWGPIALGVVLVAWVGWRAQRRAARTAGADRVVGILLLLTVANGFVLAPELLLRSVGFRHDAGVDFAPGPEVFQRFTADSALFWRWDDRFGLNSLGYPAPEPKSPKSASTFRILYLGDSCTWSSYPIVVESLLAPTLAARGRVVETVNLAVPGYSSHQGRVLADRVGEIVQPDLVVVMFGWNDHWPAFGAIDAEKIVRVDNTRGSRLITGLYQKSRTLQGVAWLASRFQPPVAPLSQVRVPINHFTGNLVHIGQRFTKLGIPVFFMTLPTAHERHGVPPALSTVFHLDAATMIRLHQQYVEGVREVARAQGWPLVDLHRSLADHPTIQKLFTDDGIHYSDIGKAAIGSIVAKFIGDSLLSQQ